eukprot:gene3626-4516_t
MYGLSQDLGPSSSNQNRSLTQTFQSQDFGNYTFESQRDDDDDDEDDIILKGNNIELHGAIGNKKMNLMFEDPLGIEPLKDMMASQNGVDITGLDFNNSVPGSRMNFEEPDDFESLEYQLPPHACSYCGIHDHMTVVKCTHPSCGKWFCNGRGKTKSSHIITHLVKSKHNEISLHQESPFGDTVLECFNCGCTNIFLLGFIPAKTESVVILLCRDPCAISPSKDLHWDLSKWVPLIDGSDRSFLSWLVKVPSEVDQERSKQITIHQIYQLEECWKSNPNFTTIFEQHGLSLDVPPRPTLLKYEDAFQYQEIISPLIKMEADYEKTMRESLSQDGVGVRWEQSLNKKWTAYFSFSRADYDFKLIPGDELKIQCRDTNWESIGRVTRIADENEVSLELYNSDDVPVKTTTKFRVDMVWRSTSFDRIQAALKAFALKRDSLSSYLYHLLLGHELKVNQLNFVSQLPSTYSIPNLPPLNASQIFAVNKVLQSPLSLIQGPPGTGKTVVSAFLIHHLVKNLHGGEKVLVCAPSNVAIDQLTGSLHKIGLKVVRLCSKLREEVSSPVEHLTLHHQVSCLSKQSKNMSELRKLMVLKEDQGVLDSADEKRYMTLKRIGELQILKRADVICTTCVGAGDPRLSSFKFPHVLIDESTQASEPESLIPFMLGAKQVILVGDHCQLGPVLLCKKVSEAGLSRSLFERLIHLGHHPVRLTTQYRMHPSLSEFPSNMLYEGQLVNELSYKEHASQISFPWPQPNHPMFFYNSTGPEEISSSGTSFINRTEASICEKIVTKFLELGAHPSQIGIITPYEGQRAFIVNNMQKTGKVSITELYREIEVASVDSFQGREKDFILLSCVRSNDGQGIGFLQDPRRLNVALTRARFGLIILGNARVLSKDLLWNNLIHHFKNREVLVEGSLQNLKKSTVQLQKPKKLYGDGKLPVPGQINVADGFSDPRNFVDPNYGMSMIYGSSQRIPNHYNLSGVGGRFSQSQPSNLSQQQYSNQYYQQQNQLNQNYPQNQYPQQQPQRSSFRNGPNQSRTNNNMADSNYQRNLSYGMSNMSLSGGTSQLQSNNNFSQTVPNTSQPTSGAGVTSGQNFYMSMPMSQSFSSSLNDLSQDTFNTNNNNNNNKTSGNNKSNSTQGSKKL